MPSSRHARHSFACTVALLGLGASRAFAAGPSFQGLGDLPTSSMYSTDAHDVSGDGSTVVGRGTTASGPEAFSWTSAGGLQGLGELGGGSFSFRSEAVAVSVDGSVIVGHSISAGDEAFRWTSGGGMVGMGDLP